MGTGGNRAKRARGGRTIYIVCQCTTRARDSGDDPLQSVIIVEMKPD